MVEETALTKLRTIAEQSGLSLSEEELATLLPGINRSHNQILELRNFMTDRLEPAAIFIVSRRETINR